MSHFYDTQPLQQQQQQQQQQHPLQQSFSHQTFPGSQSPFSTFQNVSPEMLNFGLRTGSDLINKQRDKWMPGVSGFWDSLKYYFAVNNTYVTSKLKLVLYPLSHKMWNRSLADEFERQEHDQITRKWALPSQDINAPDLYIPLMSFLSYVLLYGLSKGLGSAQFSPETIVQAIWRCLALQGLESCVIKFGTNMLSAPVPFLDIVSYSGYKYVALCVNSIARMANGSLGVIVSLVTSCMVAYFVLKSLAAAIPPNPNGGAAESTRLFMLPGIGGFQLIIIFMLSLM